MALKCYNRLFFFGVNITELCICLVLGLWEHEECYNRGYQGDHCVHPVHRTQAPRVFNHHKDFQDKELTDKPEDKDDTINKMESS